MAYSPQVLEHFRRPRHAGLLSGAGVRTGTAGSRRKGALVRFQVEIVDGRVANAGYQVFGSPYVIAACSLAAERVIGQPAVADAAPPGRELAEALALPVEQTGVALIVEDAIRAALLSSVAGEKRQESADERR
ncbi:MAG TPA: iron-sulfur cluster assembly scaffold protein [Gammaproteobacteria bacterium]|nr:iron-sulfur cluster assembly scaffold protein [Gammaproteobacteria bacterium]